MPVVIDPVSSATSQRYDVMEKKIFGSGGRNLTVSTDGIWFRDQNNTFATIIHGDGVDGTVAEVINPVVYVFDKTTASSTGIILKKCCSRTNTGRLMAVS